MKLSLIVAMTKNQIIGKGGTIPWKIPEDMKLLKELTTGSTVIMGKNTWNSIPEKFRPLPNRVNIIVSSTLGEQKGATVTKSIPEAINEAKKHNTNAFCIGGAQIYKEMLPITDELNISWVKKEYEGDTYFPKIDFTQWKETETQEFSEFIYKKYERKK